MKSLLARLLLLVGLFGGLAPQATADSPTTRGKVAAPYTQPDEAADWKTHNWYVGLGLGYFWAPEYFEDTVQGGVYAGYLWRPNRMLGLGVEADYMLRDLGSIALDDGFASLRARVGLYVTPVAFLYVTGGVGQATNKAMPEGLRQGLVGGVGLDYDLSSRLAVRLEVMHHEHGDELFSRGELDSTVARLGAHLKF